ncbi:5-methylcytosine restriction system specificity protein McrC [Campylobacter concisus]
MFEDNSCCKYTEHQKEITFDELAKDKTDVIFLNGRHDKFKSKIKDDKDAHYILRKCKNGGFKFGNYIGRFTFKGQEYVINSHFGKELEVELLKTIDSAFFSSGGSVAGASGDIPMDYVLYASFISRLKLAKLSGFPSVYKKISFRDYALHGSLDVKNFIKKDQPFTGKISSRKSSRVPDEVVARVLLSAYDILVRKNPKFALYDKEIRNFLLTNANDEMKSIRDIDVALNSKSVMNELYKDYKIALQIARIIILQDSRYANENAVKNLNFGYLLYAPNLFELYVERLIRSVLQDEFGGKFILETQDKIPGSNLKPDFLIKDKSGKILAVLDAKYRHFYNAYLGETDCKNLLQIKQYVEEAGSNTGILIYAKSNVFNGSKNIRHSTENKIFILSVLRNDNKTFADKFKKYLKKILETIK